jgi:hypothetical protein
LHNRGRILNLFFEKDLNVLFTNGRGTSRLLWYFVYPIVGCSAGSFSDVFKVYASITEVRYL